MTCETKKRLLAKAQKALNSYVSAYTSDVSHAYDVLRYARMGLYTVKETPEEKDRDYEC